MLLVEKAAEELARQLAAELPVVEPLELTAEQKKIGGRELVALLKRRVAYHHSGLDYLSRAGLVEPLAKNWTTSSSGFNYWFGRRN